MLPAINNSNNESPKWVDIPLSPYPHEDSSDEDGYVVLSAPKNKSRPLLSKGPSDDSHQATTTSHGRFSALKTKVHRSCSNVFHWIKDLFRNLKAKNSQVS